MNKSRIRSLTETLIRRARQQGADCEVGVQTGVEFEVEVRQGKIERLVQADTRHLHLKTIVDHRTAKASSTDFNEASLLSLLDACIERAQESSQDPYSGLPDESLSPVKAGDLQLYDPLLKEWTSENKIQAALKMENICLQDSRIVNSHGAGLSTFMGAVSLANTRGFFAAYDLSWCTAGVSLQAGSGNRIMEEGWMDFSRYRQDLMSPEDIAREAVRRVTRLLGARKIKTQKVPVVFEPLMTASLLRFLYQCVNGEMIYLNQSFLSRGLNTSIASPLVNVLDDGLIPRAPGSRPFDSEGVPARRTPVIQDGVLTNYLTNTYSARKLGMNSTGNGSGPNNFYMAAGQSPPESIIRSIDRGLLLTSVMGQGLDPVTGDISRGAFGLWIENGEITYPVSEVTISGNLGEMLHNVTMVGNDLSLRRPIAGPTICISDITVAGH